MKDFAKSIRTGNESVENEYKPGSYDPKDHEWTLWKIDNEISRWRREVSYEKSRVADLERMVSSGNYGSLTNQELKEAKRALETAYMRLEQALSMKKRATGNEKVGNLKAGDYGKVEINRIPRKVKILSVDGDWATIQFVEGELKGITDQELISQIKTGNEKVGNINKVSDAKGLYEDLRDAEKSGDTAKIERYKSKAKERIRDLKAKLKELQEDETDVSSAIQIYESF